MSRYLPFFVYMFAAFALGWVVGGVQVVAAIVYYLE